MIKRQLTSKVRSTYLNSFKQLKYTCGISGILLNMTPKEKIHRFFSVDPKNTNQELSKEDLLKINTLYSVSSKEN